MKRRSRIQILTESSPAELAARASIGVTISVMLLLVVIGQVKPEALQGVREGGVDLIRPVAELISAPKQMMQSGIGHVHQFFATYQENKKLRQDNAELLKWQTAANALKRENEQLRSLMHVVPEGGLHYISARMVSDIGAANSSTALISAGARDGVKKNQAVITPEGLIGRVTDVGFLSSRVLLLSDVNSHIPVMGEKNHFKAMLSGKIHGTLGLDYVEHGDQFSLGERLLTSGDGGMLPAGIPVAEVTSVEGLNVSAASFADANVATMVTIIDYQF